MSSGAGALARMLFAQHAGHDELPPELPAHLVDARWRFPCQCPQAHERVGSARIRRGRIAPPSRFCRYCRTWSDGVAVTSSVTIG